MFMGLSEADGQVAMLRHHELVAEGQHQQFVTRMCVTSANTHPRSTAIRQQLGTLLVRAGQSLQGAHAVTRGSIGSVAASERSALA